MIRLNPPLPTQPARKFETDDGAHAVTKECEWSIEIRNNLTCKRFDERLESHVRRFSQPVLPSGQQSRDNFNVPVNLPRPGMENCAAATCIGKTEQAKAGHRIRLHLKPWKGAKRLCRGSKS